MANLPKLHKVIVESLQGAVVDKHAAKRSGVKLNELRALVADPPVECLSILARMKFARLVVDTTERLEQVEEVFKESLRGDSAGDVQRYAITRGILQDKLIQAMKELTKLERVSRPPLGIPIARARLRVVDGAG